jgi:hypothetical protein
VLLDTSKPISAQLEQISVMTYGKWMLDAGRKVKRGEKCIAYKQYRLFHRDQTEVATSQERKEYFAKKQAWTAKREAQGQAQPAASA